ELDCAAGAELGEVGRIVEDGATIKPFDGSIRAGLGTLAWRKGPLTINPDPSWKGRTINALSEPIDSKGPLRQGAQAFSTDREPPPPLRRQRVKTSLKTG